MYNLILWNNFLKKRKKQRNWPSKAFKGIKSRPENFFYSCVREQKSTKERTPVCVCVCVCVRERERESLKKW